MAEQSRGIPNQALRTSEHKLNSAGSSVALSRGPVPMCSAWWHGTGHLKGADDPVAESGHGILPALTASQQVFCFRRDLMELRLALNSLYSLGLV